MGLCARMEGFLLTETMAQASHLLKKEALRFLYKQGGCENQHKSIRVGFLLHTWQLMNSTHFLPEIHPADLAHHGLHYWQTPGLWSEVTD